MPKTTSKIFLDASVIIAAFGSSGGGSALIINAQGKSYRCITSLDVIAETLEKAPKLSTTEKNIIKYIRENNIYIVNSPSEGEKNKFDSIINDEKDRHVLASAEKSMVKILLSYDRKHIVVPKVKKALKPIIVTTPKDFLQKKLL
jgi:predicted nucleic acid-binding protein